MEQSKQYDNMTCLSQELMIDNSYKTFNFTVVSTASLYGNIMYITIDSISSQRIKELIPNMDKPAATAMMYYLLFNTHPHHLILYINLVLFHPMVFTEYSVPYHPPSMM